MQEKYECFFLVADLHTHLKPDKEDILAITDNARTIVMDHLAIGIDPNKGHLLHAVRYPPKPTKITRLLISGLITVERLQQLPTIKRHGAAHTWTRSYSFSAAVLQAADILLPAPISSLSGKDNESHVELTADRRRFNNAYGESSCRNRMSSAARWWVRTAKPR